jgi:Uma2 family endonuclease
MASPVHPIRYSWAEYLAFEASSNVRHEFMDGQIYGMAGGTPEHAALAAAVVGLIFGQLRGGRCRVYDADLRVRVLATGLATYPDVTIVCGPREHDPEDANSVTNPTLVVEVSSPSTEQYDRGEKFNHYSQIASLLQYVLVSHDERRIEVWTRDGTPGWARHVCRDGEVAELGCVDARLDVDELYDAVQQPPA